MMGSEEIQVHIGRISNFTATTIARRTGTSAIHSSGQGRCHLVSTHCLKYVTDYHTVTGTVLVVVGNLNKEGLGGAQLVLENAYRWRWSQFSWWCVNLFPNAVSSPPKFLIKVITVLVEALPNLPLVLLLFHSKNTEEVVQFGNFERIPQDVTSIVLL
ncbi:unnamed protein product [Haemonchus placei]|uniref:Dirigent protein n=1 Tax=Haemonchus placei TaxID=6290 RepID=A0A0N4W608_HAEPC|nr:unnamed protein product [Haemonchus placei]